MNRTIRRGRARLVPRVPAELAERLSEVCASTNTTETAVVEVALRQHLDGTSDRTLLFRRLDRLDRAIERTHRDAQLLAQAFAVFVQLWLAHAPTLNDDERKAARKTAESRYKQFVEHVGKQFSGGRRFLDDLPRELVADEAELEGIAQGTRPRGASAPPEGGHV
jgi:predicted transcriptional regulator